MTVESIGNFCDVQYLQLMHSFPHTDVVVVLLHTKKHSVFQAIVIVIVSEPQIPIHVFIAFAGPSNSSKSRPVGSLDNLRPKSWHGIFVSKNPHMGYFYQIKSSQILTWDIFGTFLSNLASSAHLYFFCIEWKSWSLPDNTCCNARQKREKKYSQKYLQKNTHKKYLSKNSPTSPAGIFQLVNWAEMFSIMCSSFYLPE